MPFGSVTWNARCPHSSARSGMVIGTPSVVRRASFGVEVRDYQREDHAGRVGVALIIGQGCETAPQENDVHPEVVAGHRCFVESCARAAINARLTREDSAI